MFYLFDNFDGDGNNDLVFSSYGAGQDNLWGVMYNLGNRELSVPEWFDCDSECGFYQLKCRDLDNDNREDKIGRSFRWRRRPPRTLPGSRAGSCRA